MWEESNPEKTKGDALCKECFFWAFETEIHFTIVQAKLFQEGDYVAIGASGGKDSTVLAYIMKTLNDRYDYKLKLALLSIDEEITGYRDDSLETVQRNRDRVNGHNADDIAETVIMNILRGDIASEDMISGCKPFKYTYEKEIVM